MNHVRVDMYPTVEGKTVTDLSQSEIELQEDGVPQKVAHFEHVFLSGPLRQPRMFRPGFSIVPARR